MKGKEGIIGYKDVYTIWCMFYFKGLKMPILLRILASKIQKFKAKVPENLKIFRILSHFIEKKDGILGCMDTLKPYNSVIKKN